MGDHGPEPHDVAPAVRQRLPRSVYWRRRAIIGAVPLVLGAMAWRLADAGSSDHGLGATSTTMVGSTKAAASTTTSPFGVVAPTTATPLTAAVLGVSTPIAATTLPWRLPAAVSGATAVVNDGEALVLGGRTSDGNPSAAVVSVDLHTGTSRSLLGLARPVEDAAGAVLGTRVVVMGGRGASAVQSVEGRSATILTDLPGARAGAAMVTYGREVVLLGGSDGALATRDVLRTSDGESFATIGQLAVPVAYAAAAMVDGKVIVVGGETSGGIDSVDIQVFDLSTGTSTVIGRLSQGRSHAASAVLGGKLHLFGGRSGATVLDTIDRLELDTVALTPLGRLPGPTSDAAVAVLGDVAYVLGGSNGGPTDAVTQVTVTVPSTTPVPAPAAPAFDGQLLIADRGNGRLIMVNANHEIVWQYPSANATDSESAPVSFNDVIFTRDASAIMGTSPGQDTIIEISYPSGAALWTYGRADRAGSGFGFLNEPRDAFRRDDGSVIVADAGNCRVVEISAKKIPTAQMGTVGNCHDHEPPNRLAGPTSVTPLVNGNILVAEVNGSYVNELTPGGARVWTTRLAINRPSEPRQVGVDRYLVTDASRPGGVYEFTRTGDVVFSHAPPWGEAMLDHPVQAAMLPNGLIAVSDTNRHRVVVIDPATSAIVWQYGQSDVPGSGPNQLTSPGGFDLLATDGSTPLHPGNA